MFCTKETSKVIFLKNVCSGAEGERKEYCFRQSALDIKRWISPYIPSLDSVCHSRCRWKGILTALATNERGIILMKCLGLWKFGSSLFLLNVGCFIFFFKKKNLDNGLYQSGQLTILVYCSALPEHSCYTGNLYFGEMWGSGVVCDVCYSSAECVTEQQNPLPLTTYYDAIICFAFYVGSFLKYKIHKHIVTTEKPALTHLDKCV